MFIRSSIRCFLFKVAWSYRFDRRDQQIEGISSSARKIYTDLIKSLTAFGSAIDWVSALLDSWHFWLKGVTFIKHSKGNITRYQFSVRKFPTFRYAGCLSFFYQEILFLFQCHESFFFFGNPLWRFWSRLSSICTSSFLSKISTILIILARFLAIHFCSKAKF